MSSRQSWRLGDGGAIDRGRPLRFTYEGRAYEGFAGDTLASALLANEVRVVGRSFKVHRPRGILAAGTEECNALMQIGSGARSSPNIRATEIPLYDGLEAKPVNCWPSARFDVGGINNLLSRFLSAGFYYKTFMWPSWHAYEWAIRRAAGMGRAADAPDPDRYESRFAHCDVLVIGAGPAGLAAARAAAAGGCRVMLVEQDSAAGGALLHDEERIDGLPGEAWAARVIEELRALPEVRVLMRTTAVGYQDHNSVSLVEEVANEAECRADPRAPRTRHWLVRAGRVILATGAIERPLVFGGNDRPGVMLASAVRRYVRRFAVCPGRSAAVFTNNDDAYRTALALHDRGCAVAAVVDTRKTVPGALAEALAARSIPHMTGTVVTATRGAKGLRAIRVRDAGGRSRWIEADLLAMSGGYNPSVHLFCQSGGRPRYEEGIAAFVPGPSVQREVSVGMAKGLAGLRTALESGAAAGTSEGEAPPPRVDAHPLDGYGIEPCWLVEDTAGKAFVDFQNDVTADDIALSERESFVSVEHLKRYTTLGMAPDQGKTSNVNALAIMASLTGRSIAETGTTQYRYPFTPIALSSLAARARGGLFRPVRRMPAHARHEAAGAVLDDYGGWLRPSYYPRAGETPHAAEQREAIAVRTAAGLFEGSPLGKIEVVGADAARFLDLVYANTMSTLKPGKLRYGLMLSETGVIIDDGVTARMSDRRFIVGTSGAGADRIAGMLEEWLQCEWPDMDVIVAPVTSALAVLTVSGPSARAILADLGTDFDIGAQAFPHMSFVEGQVAGVAARVMRVSYTGETSYEINIPADEAEALWDRILAVGERHGVTPVGIDAWTLLRTEKGYLHIGADTDGTTSPLDVGWGHVLKKKVDFIGKRSLLRPEISRPDRLQIVGFGIAEGEPPLPIGAAVLLPEGGTEGYVTSSGYSPTMRKGVAMGMLRGGLARMGETVTLGMNDAKRQATIVSPTFYDPAGERLNG